MRDARSMRDAAWRMFGLSETNDACDDSPRRISGNMRREARARGCTKERGPLILDAGAAGRKFSI
jgi:hypothetical protein